MRSVFFLCSALTTLVLALPAAAQSPVIEYGHPVELQGVKKVFVDTGTDLQSRDRIIKEIQKGAPALTVVSRPEDAEVHLRFDLDDEDNYAVIVPARGRVGVSSVRRGSGTLVRVLDDKRVRVLWSYKDSQRTPLERRPSANFGREFVKLYRRYN
jgi:hypothetical protein